MDMSEQVSVSASDRPAAEPELRRTFSLWSSFSFSLAFISPCVALYGVYDLSITTAGPSFWLSFPLIFVAQFVIALALAELVSRWPIRGLDLTSSPGGCSGRAADGSAAGSTSGRWSCPWPAWPPGRPVSPLASSG